MELYRKPSKQLGQLLHSQNREALDTRIEKLLSVDTHQAANPDEHVQIGADRGQFEKKNLQNKTKKLYKPEL